MPHLFAVYLGGRAPRCRTELHDVAFAVGETIEDCHHQLLDAWFGSPEDLHVDAWVKFGCADGHRVALTRAAPGPSGPTLYYVNMGGYAPGGFMESHAGLFLVAATPAEAKRRAKGRIGPHMRHLPHADDLLEVDDCLEMSAVGDYAVTLTPAPGEADSPVMNGYFPIPKETIAAWKAGKQAQSS